MLKKTRQGQDKKGKKRNEYGCFAARAYSSLSGGMGARRRLLCVCCFVFFNDKATTRVVGEKNELPGQGGGWRAYSSGTQEKTGLKGLGFRGRQAGRQAGR